MNWRWLNSGPGAPAFNMAVDEALLEAMPRWGEPVLRFYGWTEPAATFGYFQKYSAVASTTPLRPLIRRPTGGGIVPHDADWTYSLAFPPGHEWYALRAEESYRRIHEWLQGAFARHDVATELAPVAKRAAPGQCFVGHEKFDLLWHGRKIAGAAQRRNKLGLLIQGSVQPPPTNLPRAAWEQAMLHAAKVGGTPSPVELDEPLRVRIDALVAAKYSQAGFNQNR
jgi:lipoyl(octanoyl) transferase